MVLYYRLMTQWSGLGDSTELSRMGLSHLVHSFKAFYWCIVLSFACLFALYACAGGWCE
jgi:hypothetical protein